MPRVAGLPRSARHARALEAPPDGQSQECGGDKLGIDVGKVLLSSKDPVKLPWFSEKSIPSILIVLAVRQHEGRMRWLEKSVGKPIARGAEQMTLFIPHGVEGFVSPAGWRPSRSGISSSPVNSKPRPEPAVEAAARLIRNLELPAGFVTLLHVGPVRRSTLGEVPREY